MARVDVHYVDLVKTLSELSDDIPVYGTFLDGENLYDKQLSEHGVIVMGNEGNGVSQQVADLVTERLFIPNYPIGRSPNR